MANRLRIERIELRWDERYGDTLHAILSDGSELAGLASCEFKDATADSTATTLLTLNATVPLVDLRPPAPRVNS